MMAMNFFFPCLSSVVTSMLPIMVSTGCDPFKEEQKHYKKKAMNTTPTNKEIAWKPGFGSRLKNQRAAPRLTAEENKREGGNRRKKKKQTPCLGM